ncbi:hypothetical protein H6F94_31180 [Leptolyngbya sp. FACHB-261]|nr:hypothetical protein [Leptolyngbya sp. FACHB-261]
MALQSNPPTQLLLVAVVFIALGVVPGSRNLHRDAWRVGYSRGETAGFHQGLNTGRNQGFTEGKIEGYREGLRRGTRIGLKQSAEIVQAFVLSSSSISGIFLGSISGLLLASCLACYAYRNKNEGKTKRILLILLTSIVSLGVVVSTIFASGTILLIFLNRLPKASLNSCLINSENLVERKRFEP